MPRFRVTTIGRIWRTYEVEAGSEAAALEVDVDESDAISVDEDTESVEVQLCDTNV